MTMRKVLAVATLAALSVFVGVSQSALEPAVTHTGRGTAD